MNSHPVDPVLMDPPPPPPPPPQHTNVPHSENDDEVDQLDSESEPEASGPDVSSSSLQKLEPVEEKRIPGHSLLPLARIESMIQSESVTGHLSMSKEALFLVSTATEEFVKRLVQAGYRESCNDLRQAVNYRDMGSAVMQYQELMFLGDTIPVPLPLHEAIRRREARKEGLDDPMSTGKPPSGRATASYLSKTKGKSRLVNGREKGDGSGTGVKKERKAKDFNGRWHYANGSMTDAVVVNGLESTWPPHCSWQDPAGARPPPPPSVPQNGILLYHPESDFDPTRPPVGQHVPNTAIPQDGQAPLPYQQSTFPQTETWPGQYTGPASGYLHPHGPFSRTPVPSGRTIYSQQHDTESGSFDSR